MELGQPCPDFALPATDGQTYTRDGFAGAQVLVLVQMCNHCPYVVGYQDRMNAVATKYAPRGVAVVGLNSNDEAKYPADSFDAMKTRVAEAGIPFPYLRDESQAVARALGAERTPEFYVFDADRKLVYHGRLDDNLEDPGAVAETYLADAIEAVLAGKPVAIPETKAVGCSVKWK